MVSVMSNPCFAVPFVQLINACVDLERKQSRKRPFGTLSSIMKCSTLESVRAKYAHQFQNPNLTFTQRKFRTKLHENT